MPLVYHDYDYKSVKNVLTNLYRVDFSDLETFAKKFDLGSINFSDEKKNYDILRSCVFKSFELCKKTLSGGFYEYIKNFCKKEFNCEKLIKYVIIDSLINIENGSLYTQDNNKKQYASAAEYHVSNCNHQYFALNSEYAKKSSDKIKDDYHNFIKNIHLAKEVSIFDSVIYDKKTKDDESDNDLIAISKDFEKINGLLIQHIRTNPYCFADSSLSKYKTLSLFKLKSFFLKCLYPNVVLCEHFKVEEKLKQDNRYNFNAYDKQEYCKSMYYIDLHYDFLNNIYIAIKLKEFENTKMFQYANKQQIIDVLSQCILIPDVFNKQLYIDIIFNLLASETEQHSIYGKTPNPSAITNNESIFLSNLFLSKEYISYLSKIFLPALSACFYVLLFEVLKEEKIVLEFLRKNVETYVFEYYESYINNCEMIVNFADKNSKDIVLEEGKTDDSCLKYFFGYAMYNNEANVSELFPLLKSDKFVYKTGYEIWNCLNILYAQDKIFKEFNDYARLLQVLNLCKNNEFSLVDNLDEFDRLNNRALQSSLRKVADTVNGIKKTKKQLRKLDIRKMRIMEKADSLDEYADDLKKIEEQENLLKLKLEKYEKQLVTDDDIKIIENQIFAIVDSVRNEYINRLHLIVKDGLTENLVPLYEAIRKNIFCEKKIYNEIKKTLSITENQSDSIAKFMLEFFVRLKVQSHLFGDDNENELLSNPIVNEIMEVKEYFSFWEMYFGLDEYILNKKNVKKE